MTPTYDDGQAVLYCGDVREVLRALPAESVLDEDVLMGTRVIQCPDSVVQAVSFKQNRVRHDSPLEGGDLAPSGALFTFADGGSRAILTGPELQQQFSLLALDSEIGQQCSGHHSGLLVGHRPAMQWLTALSGRFLYRSITAKETMEEVDCLRLNLLDSNLLAVDRRACIATNPHVIGAAPNREIAVGVKDACEVSEFGFLQHPPRKGGEYIIPERRY